PVGRQVVPHAGLIDGGYTSEERRLSRGVGAACRPGLVPALSPTRIGRGGRRLAPGMGTTSRPCAAVSRVGHRGLPPVAHAAAGVCLCRAVVRRCHVVSNPLEPTGG